MAQTQRTSIPQQLKAALPTKKINAAAKETGFVLRESKLDVPAFLWTLLLGFPVGAARTLAALHRTYERASGDTLSSSSYQERFTPELVRLMRSLFKHVLSKTRGPHTSLTGSLAGFADLMLVDSTLVRLHDLLAKAYPGTRTNHSPAALKAHLVYSVTGEGDHSLKVTSGRTNDGPILRAGAWVKDRLLLFDLGYYRFQLFDCIDREGGFFITRAKTNLNAKLISVHRAPDTKGKKLVGMKLQDAIPLFGQETIDVEVELGFMRRGYRGRRSRGTFKCRLVGVWNAEAQRHHLYLTNVPPERLSAEEVAAAYSARWLVELAFREAKSTYRLDQMPSAKRAVVETLLYAAFISFFLGRALLAYVRAQTKWLGRRVPEERWAIVFAEQAVELLLLMLRPARTAAQLSRALLRNALDPNKKNPLLYERAAGSALP